MATTSMSVQDALWLTMDRPNNLMVVDGAMMLRGVPDHDSVREVFADVVRKFPVFGRRPVKSGLGWAWQDDPDFDIEAHLNRVEFDEPITMAEVQAFLAEKRSVPMPKDRPLWTSFLLHPVQLSDGTLGSASVSRFHHSIADGVRLTQVMLGMCESDGADVAAKVHRKGVQRPKPGAALSPPTIRWPTPCYTPRGTPDPRWRTPQVRLDPRWRTGSVALCPVPLTLFGTHSKPSPTPRRWSPRRSRQECTG